MNQRTSRCPGWVVLLLAAVVTITGCDPDAKIGQRTGGSLDGGADDADPATPEDTYMEPDLSASDGASSASSVLRGTPELQGSSHAVPGDAAAGKPNAKAWSFNKSEFPLVVEDEEDFSFDIELAIEGIRLVENGELDIDAYVWVLDAQGHILTGPHGGAVAGSAPYRGSFEFRVRPDGTVGVTKNGDPNTAQSLVGNDFGDQVDGSTPGIHLAVGTYQLKIELNLRARAPLRQEGPKAQAHADRATLTVTFH